MQGMATVRNVQRHIRRVEGVDVHFVDEGPGPTSGRDIRDDRSGVPTYPYVRAAADKLTVGAWVATRFKVMFPGFDVVVLDGTGHAVNTRTKLSTVRASYRAS
jgi:hypothetical protein